MDWIHTLTIIGTITGLIVALYRISREDIALVREDMKRHDIELAESRREFSRAHALWADLLNKINDVKCDQPRRNGRKRRKFGS